MNTTQLQQYMLSDSYIKQYYGGVLARDQIPIYVNKPKIFIVNTDPINQPGQHWVSMWIDEVSEHFDSIGQKPLKDFEHFLISNGPQYMFNSKRLQNYNSNVCGQYCLFYAYYRCRGYKFKEIIDMFSKNLMLNDVKVNSLSSMM